MLRASSLGPILTSTYRSILEPCPPKYYTAFHWQARTTYTTGVGYLKPSQLEHRDMGNVHSASSAQMEQLEDSQKTDAAEKEFEAIKNIEQPTTESTNNVAQRMLSRERKGWKNIKNQHQLYVRQELPYVSGKSSFSIPLRPLYGGKFKAGPSYKRPDELSSPILHPNLDATEEAKYGPEEEPHIFDPNAFQVNISDENLYYHLCNVIAQTTDVEDAWTAYSTILSLPSPKERLQGHPPIPFQYLHRLCRLLSRNRLRTRTQFLRLLSIVYSIRKHGGTVHKFEWNSLIANAGSGWRGSTSHDFSLALDIFEDMVSGANPGASFSPIDYPALDDPLQPVEPDIYTYNTLINIAAKTLYGRTIARATAMLQSSGHPPDRITHLTLLVYFAHTRQLHGVRSTLLKMRQQKLELGLDGINACIWAYGRSGNLEWVDKIYRVLRHNAYPEPEDVIGPIIEGLKDEFIDISPILLPNAITFSTVIQLMAWHGHLSKTYAVLMEMLSSLNMEPGAPLVRDEEGQAQYTVYGATYHSFRCLFLGFSRHGIYLRNDFTSRLQDRKWTLGNLQAIFDTYIDLPEPIPPSGSMVYWVMVAFDRTSDHNVELMRKVWMKLEEHFELPLGGPQHRLRVLRNMLFSSDAERYLKKHGFRTVAPKRDSSTSSTRRFYRYNPE
ncbi:hypothetical protein D9757_000315 [Collybiopsis confluens]|uniref:Pentatricopeptide repeat protein n=1 Tax=Collybiopsis confluens TaxID=2823264 RepID=A0A8H5I2J9_9AGAR|nr:hypothetical protein D9757_000315 [Collybiopsis confluens]